MEVELASLVPDLRANLEQQKLPGVLSDGLKAFNIDVESELHPDRVLVQHESEQLDYRFADLLTTTLTTFIKNLTPLVDRFEEEGNEVDTR